MTHGGLSTADNLPASQLHLNTSIPSPIESVPVEIITEIIRHLALSELASCSRTSRQLYLLAAPRLYHTLTVDLEAEINPLIVKPASAISRLSSAISRWTLGGSGGEKPSVLPGEGKGKGSLPGFLARQKPTTSNLGDAPDPLPHRYTFIKHLTVLSHDKTLCSSFSEIELPNLQSLRIFPSWDGPDTQSCKRHHSYGTGYGTACQRCRPCPFTSSLQPRKLIMGGESAESYVHDTGLWGYPEDELSPTITEVILHVGPYRGMELWQAAWMMWAQRVPSTVESLTLVIRPPEYEWYIRNGVPEMRKMTRFDPRISAEMLWDKIGITLAGKAGRYTVVGMEMLDQAWSGKTLEQEEEAVREAAKTYLVGNGAEEKEARERAEAIVFMERAVYDKKEKRGRLSV